MVTLPKLFQPYYCADLIRLGKDNDGGYLVNTSDIKCTETLISFGIGDDDSFEKAFQSLNKCPAFAYDGTVGLLENITPDNIVQALNHDRIFLKCDIEGAEYPVLDEIIRQSGRMTGLVIEFHEMWNHMEEITNFISKLHLRLIHFHANTWGYMKRNGQGIPSVIELTFTSSRNIIYDTKLTIPHTLDMPNNPDASELKLTFSVR